LYPSVVKNRSRRVRLLSPPLEFLDVVIKVVENLLLELATIGSQQPFQPFVGRNNRPTVRSDA
jgi:hypothetical protein